MVCGQCANHVLVCINDACQGDCATAHQDDILLVTLPGFSKHPAFGGFTLLVVFSTPLCQAVKSDGVGLITNCLHM